MRTKLKNETGSELSLHREVCQSNKESIIRVKTEAEFEKDFSKQECVWDVIIKGASCLSEQTGNPLAIQFLQRLQVHQEVERLKYRNISQEDSKQHHTLNTQAVCNSQRSQKHKT